MHSRTLEEMYTGFDEPIGCTQVVVIAVCLLLMFSCSLTTLTWTLARSFARSKPLKLHSSLFSPEAEHWFTAPFEAVSFELLYTW